MSKSEKVTPIKQGNQGPISNDKLKQYKKNYESEKAEMDEARGEIGAMIKQFEEDGGNKKAFKVACALANMESDKAQDFLRSLEHYVSVFGVWDQIDMLDGPAQIAEAAE